MAHANARTNLFARRLMVERVAAGWPAAHVAEQLGVSRATVHKWLRRHAAGGDAALADRSSRPVRMPNRTSRILERKVLAARRRRKRVRSARRSQNCYEHPRPGAMIHVDVKKLGQIPAGGGWRLHGRDAAASVANRHKKTKIGYDYVHTAIDDHTRLAYSEIHPDEKDPTCAGFLHRALAWFAGHGITVRRVLTDNAMVYRHGTDWGWVCTAWQLQRRFTKPGCPWTNGKAERFNRTLQTEWAHTRAWTSNNLRRRGLDRFSPTTTLDAATPPSADTHQYPDSPPDNNVSGHDS